LLSKEVEGSMASHGRDDKGELKTFLFCQMVLIMILMQFMLSLEFLINIKQRLPLIT